MGHRIDLILHGSRSGEENMALDRDALQRAEGGEAVLRIYAWDRPTVSLGRSQKVEDIEALFPFLPTVTRPSGGGAVLHGSDVTVAVAMPLAMLEVRPRELRETYLRLITPLQRALSACGLRCHLAEEGTTGSGPDCFAGKGKVDLILEESGRKVAGCALVATRAAALLQASVPAVAPPEWLRLSPETWMLYTNPSWRHDRISRALPAAWRDAGYDVRLRQLDPRLSDQRRAEDVLWNDLDPIGVNGEPSALDEYDDYVKDFVQAASPRGVQIAIDHMRAMTKRRVPLDAETIFQRLQGF